MQNQSASASAGHSRQRSQETDDKSFFRAQHRYNELEQDMPFLKNRFQFSLKDNLTSYLGKRNPFYTNVDPETDYVWLLDNTAYQDRLGKWKGEFVAAYFVKNSGKDLSQVVAWISDRIGLAEDDQARETIAKRVQPLLDSILPARSVKVQFQGAKMRLGPSGRDGISSDNLAIPSAGYKDGEEVTSRAIEATATPLITRFATAKGWAVISDVDDTIKKTLTASSIGILKTTFADEPEPIQGMPEFYKHLVQKLDTPPIWYLSASPYNLYPFLREFRESYYPPGTLILRDASWMNLAGFVMSLTERTLTYKVDRMEKIYRWFPKRKFVCIGDSTQHDPESYAEIYRRHPKWIGAIYIRKVIGVEPMDEDQKNSPERFEQAFKNVPKSVWYVFDDPKELYQRVDALVQQKV